MTTRPGVTRLLRLEGRLRQRRAERQRDLQHAMTEAFGMYLEVDLGLSLEQWDRHGAALLALAGAALGTEPDLDVMLARGEAAFTEAMRAAVSEMFAFRDGRAVLRLDGGDPGERPPWERSGWRPFLTRHGEEARIAGIARELHALE